MKYLFSTGILCIAAGFLMEAPAVAQTLDGETPANEGVCDGLQGTTPGLYGLCVAFCEAQDHAALSVPITEEELEALEDDIPSGRILANYNKKKKAGDPDMPCIKVEEPCPCWDSAEFDQATLSGTPFNSCRRWNGPIHNGSEILFVRSSPGDVRNVRAIDHQHTTGNYGDGADCVWRIFSQPENINISRILGITPDELTACDTQIRQRMTDLSLTCSDSS